LIPENIGTFPLPEQDERHVVLIVDEHPSRPMRLARCLEAGGFACEVTHDGASALQQIHAGSIPDAVVITAQACLLSPMQPLDLLARHSPGRPVLVLIPPGHEVEAGAWPAGLDLHRVPADADVRTLRGLLRGLVGDAAPG
jgi:hypothetical protein